MLASHAGYPGSSAGTGRMYFFWFLICSSGTGKQTPFTQNNIGEMESSGHFTLLAHTIWLLLFILIIKDTKWMSHPFRCFASIAPPEKGITSSHESSLFEFTKAWGFQMHSIYKRFWDKCMVKRFRWLAFQLYSYNTQTSIFYWVVGLTMLLVIIPEDLDTSQSGLHPMLEVRLYPRDEKALLQTRRNQGHAQLHVRPLRNPC